MVRPRILVVGSFVKDLIVSASRFPERGETVLGTGFRMATGGKGANQAVEAARVGARVTMVGKVGDDAFGRDLVGACEESGIDCSGVMVDLENPSSVGNVQLQVGEDGSTENRIIVVPGANMTITPEEIAFLETEIGQFDMVLLQLEIPMEINELVAEYASRKGVPVMLNTAPSDQVGEKLLSRLTYLSCNEHEALDLTGIAIRKTPEGVCEEDVRQVIESILEKGVQNVLVTLGTDGAAFGNKESFCLVPTLTDIHSVDPTGAGDAFIGAFCTFVSMGIDNTSAIRMANYVGSLTVSVMGAQTSLPTLEQVGQLISQRGEEDLCRLVEEVKLCVEEKGE